MSAQTINPSVMSIPRTALEYDVKSVNYEIKVTLIINEYKTKSLIQV